MKGHSFFGYQHQSISCFEVWNDVMKNYIICNEMMSFMMDNDYKTYDMVCVCVCVCVCYIFNSLIFRSRIVYRILNLAAAHRGDCCRGYYMEQETNQRQGGWDRKQRRRDSDEPRQYANLAAVSGRKSRTEVQQAWIERRYRWRRFSSLHSYIMYFRVSTGSVRQTLSMMAVWIRVMPNYSYPGSEPSE